MKPLLALFALLGFAVPASAGGHCNQQQVFFAPAQVPVLSYAPVVQQAVVQAAPVYAPAIVQQAPVVQYAPAPVFFQAAPVVVQKQVVVKQQLQRGRSVNVQRNVFRSR